MQNKDKVKIELNSLEIKHKLASKIFIIDFFGKRAKTGFIYDSTKQNGGIVLSQQVKEVLLQYNADITAKMDSELVKTVQSSLEVVLDEIEDEYADLLLAQRAEYKTLADQFTEEYWKSIMTASYRCHYTKDQLIEEMNLENVMYISLLVINEICKAQEASESNFVKFINNQGNQDIGQKI